MKEENITLASMHSISKGFYGECGRRGGYLELMNVNSDVVAEFYKLASINLCSNVNGQICMAMVMNPPKVRLIELLLSCNDCVQKRVMDLSPNVGVRGPQPASICVSISMARPARPWS